MCVSLHDCENLASLAKTHTIPRWLEIEAVTCQGVGSRTGVLFKDSTGRWCFSAPHSHTSPSRITILISFPYLILLFSPSFQPPQIFLTHLSSPLLISPLLPPSLPHTLPILFIPSCSILSCLLTISALLLSPSITIATLYLNIGEIPWRQCSISNDFLLWWARNLSPIFVLTISSPSFILFPLSVLCRFGSRGKPVLVSFLIWFSHCCAECK